MPASYIQEKFASNHPKCAVLEQKVIYAHPQHDWALGNLDRMIICPNRGRGIFEIKTASDICVTNGMTGISLTIITSNYNGTSLSPG
ncbi:YqaJ viral recombinase family protein [Brevibacillus laterosporus]|uniref:YqaJ viral recombinase family protein n=1 Tax=Brevibacillus laterosporus TaxID=1465 RepID=UPI0002F48E7C|nr:hypothetical protein DM460_22440 [Brevibacillus laterosporus]